MTNQNENKTPAQRTLELVNDKIDSLEEAGKLRPDSTADLEEGIIQLSLCADVDNADDAEGIREVGWLLSREGYREIADDWGSSQEGPMVFSAWSPVELHVPDEADAYGETSEANIEVVKSRIRHVAEKLELETKPARAGEDESEFSRRVYELCMETIEPNEDGVPALLEAVKSALAAYPLED